MRNVTLGSTGLQVSNICLGAMTFGWTADERESFRIMDAYAEAGGNFLDTADYYSAFAPGHKGGESEEIIGRWMKKRGNRDRIVVATKVGMRMWEGPDGEGLGKAHIERAVEDSLRRLQVNTIDVYQCHWPDGNTPIEETLECFAGLIAAGKVRYIGGSNYDGPQLLEAQDAANRLGVPAFAILQPHYSLIRRRVFETELLEICLRDDIGVIPYSPLGGGFLTGKYRPDTPLPESERAYRVKKFMTDEGFAVLAAVEDIAPAHNTTSSAVAVAWCLARPGIHSPIIGANTVAQLADVLPGAAIELSADEIERLNEVSAGY